MNPGRQGDCFHPYSRGPGARAGALICLLGNRFFHFPFTHHLPFPQYWLQLKSPLTGQNPPGAPVLTPPPSILILSLLCQKTPWLHPPSGITFPSSVCSRKLYTLASASSPEQATPLHLGSRAKVDHVWQSATHGNTQARLLVFTPRLGPAMLTQPRHAAHSGLWCGPRHVGHLAAGILS